MTQQVLVTGANGHLGYNLCKQLVEKGYQVRAGVRDRNNEEKYKHLLELEGVELVQADILSGEQLVSASEGCDAVFHVAAVFSYSDHDPENTIIKPTIEGVQNMMEAVRQNEIDKIVLTSSIVAMGNSATEEQPLNEKSWNENTQVPYAIGKWRSEKYAWDFAQEHDITMATVNPSLILGPDCYRITPSIKVISDIMENKFPLIPPLTFNLVDVRDVADAHIRVYERGDSRRYIAATKPMKLNELIETVKRYDSGTKKPPITLPKPLFKFYVRVHYMTSKLLRREPMLTPQQARELLEGDDWTDTTPLQNLGWSPRPVDETIEDTVKWIRGLS